jgi:tRNA nucleotidyltransferase/poly(A) polymerase
MRDMLGGFPIRDLDITVEGQALKLVKILTQKKGARSISLDETRKSAELEFPGGARCEIAMARQERYAKPGSPPKVTPATIHEDLRRRDFTVNAIALSLNPASRGLLIDPTNGQSDLERKELRQVSSYGFYDDPVRLLRLIRLKARLGYTIDERTQNSYLNAREAHMERYIQPRQLFNELYLLAFEPTPLDVLKALEDDKLLPLFSPALAGAKLNSANFQKLARTRAAVPFGSPIQVDNYGLFLWVLTQLLTPKEKSALIATTQMTKPETEPWQKLEARARKLESALKSAKLSHGSQVYAALIAARGEETFLLSLKSSHRLVQDRVKSFFTRYLPTAMELTDAEVAEVSGLSPADPKFAKARLDRTNAYLDGRVKKPVPPPLEEAPPPQPPGRSLGRAARFR